MADNIGPGNRWPTLLRLARRKDGGEGMNINDWPSVIKNSTDEEKLAFLQGRLFEIRGKRKAVESSIESSDFAIRVLTRDAEDLARKLGVRT